MPVLLILKSYFSHRTVGFFSITRSLNSSDSSFRQAAAWSPWRDVTILITLRHDVTTSWAKRKLPRASSRLEMSRDMRFPTMWYVWPAKTQISLRIHAVWSEPLLVAWIFYECYDTDWTSFWVSKLKRRLHRLVWVYTCQNATFIVWKAHVAAQITNPHGIQWELPFKGPSSFKIVCRVIYILILKSF